MRVLTYFSFVLVSQVLNTFVRTDETTFKFVEFHYKETKKNEIIFQEFETACQQTNACVAKRGIDFINCFRECISPSCYSIIYKPDEFRMSSHGGAAVTVGVPVMLTENINSPAYVSWRKLQLSKAKLKASSKTSALLSGFAMVAMVEVNISNGTAVPQEMLIAFTVCTTLLVAVHMLALMISTCILPNIDAVCSLNSVNFVHESPHERLHWYIETAWAFSTLLGLILFLFEIALLCWVKFYEISKLAAWSACIVLIPVLIIFIAFAMHFYLSMVAHKYEVSRYGIRELELLKEQIEANDSNGGHISGAGGIDLDAYSHTRTV